MNIKVASYLPGATNAFDTCTMTVADSTTNTQILFYLWNARDDDTPVHRVSQTQRLALVREAAFRKLTVHITAEPDSSIVTAVQVDMP